MRTTIMTTLRNTLANLAGLLADALDETVVAPLRRPGRHEARPGRHLVEPNWGLSTGAWAPIASRLTPAARAAWHVLDTDDQTAVMALAARHSASEILTADNWRQFDSPARTRPYVVVGGAR